MSDEIKIPAALFSEAIGGLSSTRVQDHQAVAHGILLGARWMREECAKVAAAHHSHAGVWCSHNKCAVALIEQGIRKVGNT